MSTGDGTASGQARDEALMLRVLLDLAVGFLVESVVGSPSTQGREFQREMHSYLDQRTGRGSAPSPAPRPG
jgi:hypothetical protein